MIIFSYPKLMSYKKLYLVWDFNGVSWKGYKVVSSVPDLDGSVRLHLETHAEQYYTIAQLHADGNVCKLHGGGGVTSTLRYECLRRGNHNGQVFFY
jgi:hypothetical protein